MRFYDDPRREAIEPMHEYLTMWANYWRDFPTQHVSITWVAMCSIRDWSNVEPNIREGIVLGRPIKTINTERAVIAEKVRVLFRNTEKWRGHHRDREVLMIYYAKTRPNQKIGYIARLLNCKPWLVEKTVKDALFYMSTVWE